MESKGTPWRTHGGRVESQNSVIQALSRVSDPSSSLGSSAPSCARVSPLPGGTFPDPAQDPLLVTLVDDPGLPIIGSRTQGNGGHACTLLYTKDRGRHLFKGKNAGKRWKERGCLLS